MSTVPRKDFWKSSQGAKVVIAYVQSWIFGNFTLQWKVKPCLLFMVVEFAMYMYIKKWYIRNDTLPHSGTQIAWLMITSSYDPGKYSINLLWSHCTESYLSTVSTVSAPVAVKQPGSYGVKNGSRKQAAKPAAEVKVVPEYCFHSTNFDHSVSLHLNWTSNTSHWRLDVFL